jgi:hypothetical protein
MKGISEKYDDEFSFPTCTQSSSTAITKERREPKHI